MNLQTKIAQNPLVTITTDKDGLLMLIQATKFAINHLNNFNFGDEYDTDTTPYHDVLELLKNQFVTTYGELP